MALLGRVLRLPTSLLLRDNLLRREYLDRFDGRLLLHFDCRLDFRLSLWRSTHRKTIKAPSQMTIRHPAVKREVCDRQLPTAHLAYLFHQNGEYSFNFFIVSSTNFESFDCSSVTKTTVWLFTRRGTTFFVFTRFAVSNAFLAFEVSWSRFSINIVGIHFEPAIDIA